MNIIWRWRIALTFNGASDNYPSIIDCHHSMVIYRLMVPFEHGREWAVKSQKRHFPTFWPPRGSTIPHRKWHLSWHQRHRNSATCWKLNQFYIISSLSPVIRDKVARLPPGIHPNFTRNLVKSKIWSTVWLGSAE